MGKYEGDEELDTIIKEKKPCEYRKNGFGPGHYRCFHPTEVEKYNREDSKERLERLIKEHLDEKPNWEIGNKDFILVSAIHCADRCGIK